MARAPRPPRFEPFEADLSRLGFTAVAGVDEVGRGCLAGAVVAAAVILPEGFDLTGIDDSKKLTAEQRERVSARILAQARAVAVGEASVDEIFELNILWASHLAMKRALAALPVPADALLVDGNQALDSDLHQLTVVKGDSRCASIAAASIVAKVHRDAAMVRLAQAYPGFAFEDHKGYGTEAHRDAIARLGPTPQHRRAFRGVAEHWPASAAELRPAVQPGEQLALFSRPRG